MAQDDRGNDGAAAALTQFFEMQGQALREMFSAATSGRPAGVDELGLKSFVPEGVDPAALGDGMAQWAASATQLQQLWLDFVTHQASKTADQAQSSASLLDPAQWLVISQSMLKQMPQDLFKAQGKLIEESMQLWQGVAERFMPKPARRRGRCCRSGWPASQ
jgi:polyhydroxyalkanoate synthase subunit PhaC